jgi:hypothetical protein
MIAKVSNARRRSAAATRAAGMPEVGVRGAGGDHQEVVRQLALVDAHPAGVRLDRVGLGQQHRGVGLASQDAADRLGDVGGVERRRGHLVQQRLEQVMVAPIDERHLHGAPAQTARRVEAREASSDDHDVRAGQRRAHARILRAPSPPWPIA